MFLIGDQFSRANSGVKSDPQIRKSAKLDDIFGTDNQNRAKLGAKSENRAKIVPNSQSGAKSTNTE